jgi:CHAD domain-containing protein
VSTRFENWSLPPARFAEVSLEARLSKLIEQADHCLETPDPDAVHDLRVAIRRFSQALRIFRQLLDAKALQHMRRALRRVMDAAATVRDLDVGMERLIGEGLPEDHAVIEEMRSERRRGELALRGWLFVLKSDEPQSAWRACLAPRPAKGAGARAS